MKISTSLINFCIIFAQLACEAKHAATDGTSPIMLISDIYAAHKFATNGREELAEPEPDATVDPSKIPSIKLKQVFSPTCTEKICTMFYYALSCKALNLGFSKECASYFLGANFGCSQFPSPADFYDAPSVCANQIAGLVGKLATGDIITAMSEYLGQTFQTTSCGRRCYQNYQYASNDFYETCHTEMYQGGALNTTIASTYVIATKIANFQQFRNQACAEKPENGTNCYVEFSALASVPNPPVNIFDMECNYAGMPPGTALPPYIAGNNKAFAGVCGQFTSFGCCAANDVTMYQQAQTNPADLSIMPPCMMNYLSSNNCPAVDFQNYCKNGSIASVTTYVGTATMPRVAPGNGQKFQFPSMYNKTDIAQVQGVISTAFVMIYEGNNEPWQFISKYPFQVQILSYAYFGANGVALTPYNTTTGMPTGLPAYPLGSDYTNGESIQFTFQLTFQNVASLQAAVAYLENPGFVSFVVTAGLDTAYLGSSQLHSSFVENEPAAFMEAQPLAVPPKNGALSGSVRLTEVVGLVVLASSLLAYLVI